jgi:hypothetical protein
LPGGSVGGGGAPTLFVLLHLIYSIFLYGYLIQEVSKQISNSWALFAIANHKKIVSENRKPAKCHICGRSANLTNYSITQICGFAICGPYVRTAQVMIKPITTKVEIIALPQLVRLKKILYRKFSFRIFSKGRCLERSMKQV